MKVSDVMIRVSQIKISIDDPIEKVKELLLKQFIMIKLEWMYLVFNLCQI